MNKVLLIAIVLCLSLCKLQAQTKPTKSEWIYVTEDADHNKYFIQSNYLTKVNGTYKIWTKCEEKKTVFDGKTYYNTTITSLKKFDCSERKSSLVSIVYYTSDNKLIYRHTYPNDDWDDAVPESVGTIELDKICEMFNKKVKSMTYEEAEKKMYANLKVVDTDGNDKFPYQIARLLIMPIERDGDSESCIIKWVQYNGHTFKKLLTFAD